MKPLPPGAEALPEALAGAPLDHVAIAVVDLESASRAYEVLGLRRSGRDEVVASQGVRVRTLRGGETLVELLTPIDDDGPVARFIAKRGAGLHHIALRVGSLEAELARLEAAGVPLLSPEPQPGRAGTRVSFIHPRFAGGVLIELVEHP